MLDIIIGIAIGTAFAPFWIMLWNKLKAKATEVTSTTSDAVLFSTNAVTDATSNVVSNVEEVVSFGADKATETVSDVVSTVDESVTAVTSIAKDTVAKTIGTVKKVSKNKRK